MPEGCVDPGTLRSGSAEQGTDGWDSKTREAVGAARAWEKPYGVVR